VDVPLYALLVGIDDYPHPSIPPLRGATNDVADVRSALVDGLGVPAEHVRTLTDAAATREAIAVAFEDHLVARGRAWQQDQGTGPPPAFLFYFSGHGSQAPDATGTESDGFDETLVPHDARQDAVYDIKDHEIARWLAALPGDNVTVVLDCCHSGSGTRRPGEPPGDEDGETEPPGEQDAVRSAPPDLRPQPPTAVGETAGFGTTRGVSLHGGGSHVLIAACRDHEEAFEHRGTDGRVRGAMTTFLVPALLDGLARSGTTYRELHRRVRVEVNRVRPEQSPLCEGDLDRALFSSRRVPHDRGGSAHVTQVLRKGRVWLDVGRVHGVTVGSRLRLDGHDAEVIVERLEPVRAGGLVHPPGHVPALGTPARLVAQDLGSERWRILADASLAGAVREALDDGPLTGLGSWTEDRDTADLVVERATDGAVLLDATGRELTRASHLDAFLAAAAHVARVAYLRELEQPDLGPGLRLGPRLEVRRGVTDPLTGELRAEELPSEDGTLVAAAGDRLVIEVHNDTEVPLYAAILVLTAAWEVAVLHPLVRGAEDRLGAGQQVRVGHGERDRVTATVPDGVSATTDVIRAIVTTHPTSFETLAVEPPAARWGSAAPLPVPPAGRPARAEERWPKPQRGRIASRWASASVQLTTRRAVPQPPG
jgi:hypothetical protein